MTKIEALLGLVGIGAVVALVFKAATMFGDVATNLPFGH